MMLMTMVNTNAIVGINCNDRAPRGPSASRRACGVAMLGTKVDKVER